MSLPSLCPRPVTVRYTGGYEVWWGSRAGNQGEAMSASEVLISDYDRDMAIKLLDKWESWVNDGKEIDFPSWTGHASYLLHTLLMVADAQDAPDKSYNPNTDKCLYCGKSMSDEEGHLHGGQPNPGDISPAVQRNITDTF
jgi:hypothetical protein